MNRSRPQTSAVLVALTGLAWGAVLVADLLLPLGITVWVFYLAPVALCLFFRRPNAPLWVAAATTLGIAAGFYASLLPSTFPATAAATNRAFGVVTVWALAFVVRQLVTSQLALQDREWIKTGLRDLSSRLQGELSVEQLGEGVLSTLCGYLGAAVGAFYTAAPDGRLRRGAAYALTPNPGTEWISPGEGLVGQALREARPLVFSQLPEGYLPISSSLGGASPRQLAVVPAVADGAVAGVVELGFLRELADVDLELLAGAATPMAVAIRSAQYRERLEALLAETRRQAQELQTQQEELRVSNEELESQSRALQDSQARLEAQQAELEQSNSQLEEQTQLLERQRDELARAQLAQVERADELARANQYKSEFLANMSHELRTPLNSALILAKLLADNGGGNLTAEQVRFASTIQSACNDLLALINDILDLSRIEAGRMELTAAPVDLAEVVGALTRVFEPVARSKAVRFEARLAPGAPERITTDGLRLQQVLRNLLSNALKFTERGAVILEVAAEGPSLVAFSVKDTGIGIPADKQQLVFEAFRQADGTTHRRYGGTGLGLTISRELAHRLGGDLFLESKPGAGSTFTLVLPISGGLEARAAQETERRQPPSAPAPVASSLPEAARPAPAAPPLPDDRSALAPGDRVILVVEDDPRFAGILMDLAHAQHFRCLVAGTATEGLELANRHVPSAVLLDVRLPDESGMVVLERLKRNPRTRHVPVHVISVDDYAQQALEMGAVGYALKPIKREELVRAFEGLERRLAQGLRRVLVVEDSPEQREAIAALLGSREVEIVPVSTAEQALAKLGETTFDCMVMDLSLPGMSGYDLLDRMARDTAYSFPPVIVYTGRDLTRDEELRLRRYAKTIILKGARSPERLLDEVTLFLHQVESELPQESQRMLREVRSREASLEGRRVLLAEDDVRNVFALSSVLERKGARLEIARNGREALQALERAAAEPGPGIDLVLMDIMMPEMDGLTATREIRKRPEWKRLPIIALTAKAMPDDREKCLEAGANDYVAKPIDVDKLISLIRVWMPR